MHLPGQRLSGSIHLRVKGLKPQRWGARVVESGPFALGGSGHIQRGGTFLEVIEACKEVLKKGLRKNKFEIYSWRYYSFIIYIIAWNKGFWILFFYLSHIKWNQKSWCSIHNLFTRTILTLSRNFGHVRITQTPSYRISSVIVIWIMRCLSIGHSDKYTQASYSSNKINSHVNHLFWNHKRKSCSPFDIYCPNLSTWTGSYASLCVRGTRFVDCKVEEGKKKLWLDSVLLGKHDFRLNFIDF